MLVAALTASAGCAGKGLGGGTLHVQIAAAANCNSCGKPSGYPLTYRVLQVTDASAINGLTLTQLWGKEPKLFAAALLASREDFVDPGQKKELAVTKEKGAVSMIVVGNFCSAKGTAWYVVQPLSSGGNVKLIAGPEGFTAAK